MSHRWGSLAVLMLNFLIDHCLYGITRLILILSVRPGLSWMYNVECAPILMPCMVFILCVYIYLQTILEKCPHILFIGNLSPGKVSPCIFYWQSVPMHFVLAICPHAFFIGKVSPCILYWQIVPMNFLSFRIFSIMKHSSHTALGIFFLFSLFFSPFSFLPFLFSFLCVFSSCSCYRLDMEDLGDIQVVGNFLPH